MNSVEIQLARQIAQQRYADGIRPSALLERHNAKLAKSLSRGVVVYGLSLAPGDMSGAEVCTHRSTECYKHCLFSAGHGASHMRRTGHLVNRIWVARILRTLWFQKNREGFMFKLIEEILKAKQFAAAKGVDLAIRLNVFSDIVWERQRVQLEPLKVAMLQQLEPGFEDRLPPTKKGGVPLTDLFRLFPEVQFYDYTKIPHRMAASWHLPPNYHLTFSRCEDNDHLIPDILDAGGTVTVVIDPPTNTSPWHQVIDGDEHDLRYLDPPGSIIVLKPKGSLQNSGSPFIRRDLIIVKDCQGKP